MDQEFAATSQEAAFFNVECVRTGTHSLRKATIGSVAAARRAGSQQAMEATSNTTTMAASQLVVSVNAIR